jgi:hypothetical protein
VTAPRVCSAQVSLRPLPLAAEAPGVSFGAVRVRARSRPVAANLSLCNFSATAAGSRTFFRGASRSSETRENGAGGLTPRQWNFSNMPPPARSDRRE